MILPAFGAGVQVGGRMADMQRQPEHLITERIDATRARRVWTAAVAADTGLADAVG